LSSFSSGSTIVKIEDRSAMRVKLDVTEIDVARMTLGMDATIDVDALPGRPFHGVVKKIAPASRDSANSSVQSQATSTADNVVKFQVEIRIVDPTETIRSGMSAKVTIVTARRNGVLIVPIEFVVRDGPKAYVEFEPAS
ncbi:efflux RND transporter periplasmic adaptor subunit, partial [Bacillus halotolerans]|uniref:efflux RND transporter periplasmic adaptor subunit n=1 Tax=Bacillus halotolerans TaxID=260554 RepID=UPI00192E27F0